MEAIEKRKFRKFIAEGGYDFFDFGCSAGGSIRWAQRVLGGHKGLGIDTSPAKVEAARAAGLDAISFDILDIPRAKMVRFTVMHHFLEHLPDQKIAARILRRACQVSTDFAVIAQPYFDADGLLLQQGLKLYWSHWRGHPNTMNSLDLYRCLAQLRDEGIIRHFSLHARQPILTSADTCVHPLSSPRDQHEYDPKIHPPKPKIKFAFPVFRETVALIGIGERLDPALIARMKPGTAFVDL